MEKEILAVPAADTAIDKAGPEVSADIAPPAPADVLRDAQIGAAKVKELGRVPAGEAAGIVKVGKKNFAAIYIQGKGGKAGEVAKLSDQEAVVLRSFLSAHSYEAAAKEAGITKESVKRMLRRPVLKSFLAEVIRKAAIMQGVDTSWAVKELVGVWEGAIKPNAIQMEAMKQIGRILSPKGPGMTVNVQQNSVYSGMGREAINAEWVDARAAADPGV